MTRACCSTLQCHLEALSQDVRVLTSVPLKRAGRSHQGALSRKLNRFEKTDEKPMIPELRRADILWWPGGLALEP